jgi:hypothetical protein
VIVQQLEEYLRKTRVRHVHFGDGTTAPPPLAYVTNFPRLSLPLAGCHTMEIAKSGRTEIIRPVRGHAVFVPDHAWNKPDWTGRVDVLTFLFGVKQIGISLVRHKGGSQVPPTAVKASVHDGFGCGSRKGPIGTPFHRVHAARMSAAPQVSPEAATAQSNSHL